MPGRPGGSGMGPHGGGPGMGGPGRRPGGPPPPPPPRHGWGWGHRGGCLPGCLMPILSFGALGALIIMGIISLI